MLFLVQAPSPPQKWKGVRNASEHGPICVQYTSEFSTTVIGSEDCLYLNVYSPNLEPKTPMAVMFFIHGGYFVLGSGNSDLYAGDFLVGYNIVLVTINYRLNALGFLSVDTEAASGNAGLMDQVAALKWVKKNIRCFGGDPKKVTIFGQSAGGVSVTLHMLSPAAKGLFHRAIGMSGAVFNDWAISFEHKKRAFALGRILGLNTTDSNVLIEFLQKVPAKKLVEVRPNILISDALSRNFLTTIYFTPIVEKKNNHIQQYLTESPNDLLLEGRVNKVNFMAGHAQSEGLSVTSLVTDDILEYYPQFEQLYVPIKISNIRSPARVLKVADRIRDYYITNETILSSINGFVKYYSYSHFVTEIHNFFDRYSKVNSKKQYFYEFSIYSSRNFYSQEGARKFGIRLSTHRDDIPYLFDGSAYNMTVNVKSGVYKYIDIMCRLYTNFAKYG